MAMIVNKMLKVIPRKQKITEIDCHAICSNLAQTGGELWEKVIYFVNENENCLDIKYKSRKGRGKLGIEDKHQDFDIWLIENYEGGFDNIYFLYPHKYDIKMSEEINLYCFDEIKLKGNHDRLKKDFYPNFFYLNSSDPSPYLNKIIQEGNNGFASFKVDGIYTAGTIYNVGKENSHIPELLTKEEFHKPRNVSYSEADFLIINSFGNHGMKKLLRSCINDKFSSIEWDKTNLSEIQFCFKGRVVKKIETGEYWRYYNAEFFDNTVEKNWIDYLSLWKRGLI